MAQGQAKLTEVALRQLKQNLSVDFALTKCRLISTETETAQPTTDIHARIPTRPGATIHLEDTTSSGRWSETMPSGFRSCLRPRENSSSLG